jgi:hypothetical protein
MLAVDILKTQANIRLARRDMKMNDFIKGQK